MALTKKFLLIAVLTMLFLYPLSTRLNATELPTDYTKGHIDYSEEYSTLIDGIPEDIARLLPSGIFSERADEQHAAAKEISSFKYIFNAFLRNLGIQAGGALSLLCKTGGIILLSALFGAIKQGASSNSLNEPFSICTSSAMLATILGMQLIQIHSVELFIERLLMLVNSMLPLIGVLYTFGGNVGSATSSTGTLSVFIGLCENLCGKTLMPIVSVCLVFSTVSAFAPSMNLGGLSKAVKKTYLFLLGILMTVFAAVMGAQTALASKADTLASRAAKYAVSSFIPIVGGTVGDSLKTVAASVEYIRGAVGITAIIIILLLLMPTILSLIFNRLAIIICGSAASMLGCEREEKLLDEISSIYGYMIAVSSFCSVLFIYALTIFVRTSAAIG